MQQTSDQDNVQLILSKITNLRKNNTDNDVDESDVNNKNDEINEYDLSTDESYYYDTAINAENNVDEINDNILSSKSSS